MQPDPWTGFLDWLQTVITPAWGELIDLMPFFFVIGIIGPFVTLIALLWVWHFLNRRRGRIRRVEAQAWPVSLTEDGAPDYPLNEPYCDEHGLVYPARARTCEIDRANLSVACPVDGTIRDADVETCAACGTRFVLGANAAPTVVTAGSGPPSGGAAVA
jgi:hypothetical protein